MTKKIQDKEKNWKKVPSKINDEKQGKFLSYKF